MKCKSIMLEASLGVLLALWSRWKVTIVWAYLFEINDGSCISPAIRETLFVCRIANFPLERFVELPPTLN
jgi:hypothetical protein